MRAYQSAAAPSRSFISSMIAPKTRPNPAIATVHPSSAFRCRRQTSPNGLRSRGDASAGPRRCARMPLPTSRLVASMLAAPASTMKAIKNRASGHQLSPPKGRICCPHPIGESHAGQALTRRKPLASAWPSMFPTPLTTKARPRIAAARPLAPRVVEESCTATAATPAKTMPSAPVAIPAVNDPSRGLPGHDPGQPDRDGESDVGADGDDESGGQAGVTADGGGADELGAPGLLVLPRVPDDRERAHQRGEHREQQIAADHRRRALACARGDTEDTHSRSAREELGLVDERLPVLPADPGQHPERQQRKSKHVRGELEPVAPQREPRERARARQRVHRAPTSSRVGLARREVVPVVAQEQLLERRRRARQRPHVVLDEALEDAVQLAGVDAELRTRAVDARVVDPGQLSERADRFRRLDDHGRAGEVAQLAERSRLGGSASADDRHPIAQRLDLGEDVAGQEDGAARIAQLANDVLEDDLHQRVETRGRLVQEVQLDVGRKRGDERHLLPVALRVGADPLRRVELEPLEQLGAPLSIEAAAQPAEQVDHLATCQVRPQVHLARHVRQASVECDRVAPRVAAEHDRLAAVFAQQPEQDAHGCRLAGTVRPQEAVHLPAPNREVETIERARRPETLHQPRDRDRRPRARRSPPVRAASTCGARCSSFVSHLRRHEEPPPCEAKASVARLPDRDIGDGADPLLWLMRRTGTRPGDGLGAEGCGAPEALSLRTTQRLNTTGGRPLLWLKVRSDLSSAPGRCAFGTALPTLHAHNAQSSE